MKRHAAIAILSLAAGTLLADVPAPTLDRYQVILERKPFGELLPPIAPPPPAPPPNEIPKNFRLCSIVKEDDGRIRVGVVELKTQKYFVLEPGQTDYGVKLIEANYEAENATLQLGEEIQIVELKSGTATPVGPGGGAHPQIASAPNTPPAPPSPEQGMSYADRRRQRLLQQQEPQAAPQPKYSGEALQKHLQDYQMEVIRQGLPPLPIPLTPEQDSQLVKEGVLPPQK